MRRLHWDYYLALIDDLEKLSRYVEFSEGNSNTFSIELVRLLLSIGSEIDVVSKVLCASIDPSSKAKNIDDYRKSIIASYACFPEVCVTAPKYGLRFTPWKSWHEHRNPDWWRAYNDVKHERNSFYERATLWNVLNAASGLCVLIGYLYKDWIEDIAIPRPLLYFDKSYNGNMVVLTRARTKLP